MRRLQYSRVSIDAIATYYLYSAGERRAVCHYEQQSLERAMRNLFATTKNANTKRPAHNEPFPSPPNIRNQRQRRFKLSFQDPPYPPLPLATLHGEETTVRKGLSVPSPLRRQHPTSEHQKTNTRCTFSWGINGFPNSLQRSMWNKIYPNGSGVKFSLPQLVSRLPFLSSHNDSRQATDSRRRRQTSYHGWPRSSRNLVNNQVPKAQGWKRV